MPEQSSGRTIPGFWGRLGIAILHLIIPLQTGLLIIYYVLHTIGSDLWFIDMLGFVLPWLFLPSIVLLPLAIWHRSPKILLFASIPLALFGLTYGHLYLPRLPVKTTEPTFKVMVYNVLVSNPHSDQIAAVIKTHDPDVIGLHELGSSVYQYLENQFAEDYPFRIYEPLMGYGIFSRFQIEDYRVVEMADVSRRFAQQSVLDIEGRKVTLINTHPQAPPLKGFSPFGLPLSIPTGIRSEYRNAELDGLLEHLENVWGPLLLIGDFNMSDQQPYYAELTRDLRDAHRESGWGMGFTFARFPRLGIPIWRIDYVFYSSDLVALHTTVGDFGGSDHRPVVAQLSFLKGQQE